MGIKQNKFTMLIAGSLVFAGAAYAAEDYKGMPFFQDMVWDHQVSTVFTATPPDVTDPAAINAHRMAELAKIRDLPVQQREAAKAFLTYQLEADNFQASSNQRSAEASKQWTALKEEEKKLTSLEEKAAADKKAYGDNAPLWGTGWAAGATVKANAAKYKAAADASQKALDDAKANVEKMRTAQQKEYAAAEADKKKVEKALSKGTSQAIKEVKKIEDLESKIANADVTAKLAELSSEVTDQEVRNEALERKYDQGMIGQYMKSKLAAAMASDQMCQSIKSCADGKRTEAGVAPNLDPIFFNDKGTKGTVDEGGKAAGDAGHTKP